MWNSLASSRKQKWHTARYAASNSLLKAKYFLSAGDSLALKKDKG
jgi:hypothetical protein